MSFSNRDAPSAFGFGRRRQFTPRCWFCSLFRLPRPLLYEHPPEHCTRAASTEFGERGIPVTAVGSGPYTASKGAVGQLIMALSNDGASHGVNVNVIVPGYIATDNTEALRDDGERAAAIRSRIPQGRWGEPEDFKGPVVFLASNVSNYMNGGTLQVCITMLPRMASGSLLLRPVAVISMFKPGFTMKRIGGHSLRLRRLCAAFLNGFISYTHERSTHRATGASKDIIAGIGIRALIIERFLCTGRPGGIA